MGVDAITPCTRGYPQMRREHVTPVDPPLYAIDLALGAAATARLARLVTQDTILAAPRLQFVRRMDSSGHPLLAELAVCPWCVSIWIGFVVAFAAHRQLPGYRLLASVLAFSLVAGVINEIGSEGDI